MRTPADHRAMATCLGLSVGELKYVHDLLADAIHLAVQTSCSREERRGLVAEHLGLSPAELTRLRLALARGTHGSCEREVVRRLARSPILVAD